MARAGQTLEQITSARGIKAGTIGQHLLAEHLVNPINDLHRILGLTPDFVRAVRLSDIYLTLI